METELISQTPANQGGLRAKLVSVALDILETQGIDALTLRAVARGAGVSHGAPARHFENLDDLKAEVAAVGYRTVATEIAAAVSRTSQGSDPREPLATATRAYVNYALKHPGLFSLVIRTSTLDLNNEALRHERRSASDRFLWLVRQAQAEGWKPNADPNLLASSLWASAHGLATLWLHGAYQHANPDTTLEEAIAGILELN